jgi:hypothetical protein
MHTRHAGWSNPSSMKTIINASTGHHWKSVNAMHLHDNNLIACHIQDVSTPLTIPVGSGSSLIQDRAF